MSRKLCNFAKNSLTSLTAPPFPRFFSNVNTLIWWTPYFFEYSKATYIIQINITTLVWKWCHIQLWEIKDIQGHSLLKRFCFGEDKWSQNHLLQFPQIPSIFVSTFLTLLSSLPSKYPIFILQLICPGNMDTHPK